MKSSIFAATLLCVANSSLLQAQGQPPVIKAGTVVNAASRLPQGLPDYGIAQGGLFTLIGQGLASATPPISVANSSPQSTLAGASMQITVAGTKVDVLMVSTWAGFQVDASGSYDQLMGMAPSTTPVGDGAITVTFNGRTSAPVPITIVPSAFGIFTLNHSGAGPGIFTGQDLTFNSISDAAHVIGPFFPDATYAGNTLVAAAHPGDQLVMWGTGLGADGANTPVEVHVGNTQADVVSQGGASCCAGVDQIVFTVPDGVQGCYVPVAVKIGAVVSNFASISVSPDNNVCSDSFGWSVADLQSSAGGAPVNVADIELGQVGISLSVPGLGAAKGTLDFANGDFRHYSGPPLGTLALIGAGNLPIPSSGCTVFPFVSNGPIFDNFLPAPRDMPFGGDAPYQFLEAGAGLNVKGPAGAVQLPRNMTPGARTEYKVPGSLIGGGIPGIIPVTPELLVPGNFTVDNGSGGPDVKSFNAALTIPSDRVSWTGQDAIGNIDRTQDLTVTWSGSGLAVIAGNSANPAAGIGAAFVCIAGDADNGSFTVPAWVMSALPASGLATDVPAPVAFMLVLTGLPSPVRFQASGIDVGYFNWFAGQLKNVNFQ